MDVSENNGTSKSSILIGFSIMNHPFWGIPIFGNTHILLMEEILPVVSLPKWRKSPEFQTKRPVKNTELGN